MFSVIIPYYRKYAYIERCVNAVLGQTFKDYEIILVDDGSKDDISIVCREKWGSRVQVISQENQGVSAARNKGIANATHDYIAFLDADDFWSPCHLEYVSKVIRREEQVKIIGCRYTRKKSAVEMGGEILDYTLIENYLENRAIKNTLFSSSSTVIKRSFFMENGGFNTRLTKGEDLDVWFRAVASGGKVIYVNNTLAYYSDEDIQRATNTKHNLKNSLLFLMKEEYLAEDKPKVLRSFAGRFIRKRIYWYYFDIENHQESVEVLNKVGYGNLFSRLLYILPVTLGMKLLNGITGKYLRYYSKYLMN